MSFAELMSDERRIDVALDKGGEVADGEGAAGCPVAVAHALPSQELRRPLVEDIISCCPAPPL